jgi:heme oxygenase (biliverdin-IX-beta and delta-forming)
MAGLHAFHAEAERVGAGALDVAAGRAELIRRGLDHLQAAPGPGSEAARGDLSTALGWLYVAEGSALGGRVMRKAMERDGIDLTGLDFLDADGATVGARWQGFLSRMEAAVADGCANADAVVAAALSAFDRAHVLLVPSHSEGRAA